MPIIRGSHPCHEGIQKYPATAMLNAIDVAMSTITDKHTMSFLMLSSAVELPGIVSQTITDYQRDRGEVF